MSPVRDAAVLRMGRPSREFPSWEEARRVIKIAIDKPLSRSENRGHEVCFVRSGRSHWPVFLGMRIQKAGRSSAAGSSCRAKPASAAECRNHRTLRRHSAGERQHRDLHLPGRLHQDRLQDRAHDADLQKDERGVRVGGIAQSVNTRRENWVGVLHPTRRRTAGNAQALREKCRSRCGERLEPANSACRDFHETLLTDSFLIFYERPSTMRLATHVPFFQSGFTKVRQNPFRIERPNDRETALSA